MSKQETENINGKIELSANEVSCLLATGAMIVDVRQADEYAHGHINGSQLCPLDQIETRCQEFADKNPILVCTSGMRTSEAKAKLEALNIKGLRILAGGLNAWKQAGLPLQQTNPTMPLERQVRIAAGSLALTGALLGFFIHPNFLWLSAFVGAGLVFAGITDTCGMAVCLKKMPWNKRLEH